jgi:thymidylate synthase (FAD)
MQVTLQAATPNAEVNIVEIARVSSTRKDKTEAPENLIRYLIKNKHWSPFEHSYLTFEIVTSKAIAIQFLRHVSFRFQEFSQRYAVVDAMEPIEFRLQAEKNRQSSTDVVGTISMNDKGSVDYATEDHWESGIAGWLEVVAKHLENSIALYQEGIRLGVAKETARMILPMATQTTLYMTGSIRSWIHCLQIRDDGHAQKEAQLIARAIKKLFVEELPIISKALYFDRTPEEMKMLYYQAAQEFMLEQLMSNSNGMELDHPDSVEKALLALFEKKGITEL